MRIIFLAYTGQKDVDEPKDVTEQLVGSTGFVNILNSDDFLSVLRNVTPPHVHPSKAFHSSALHPGCHLWSLMSTASQHRVGTMTLQLRIVNILHTLRVLSCFWIMWQADPALHELSHPCCTNWKMGVNCRSSHSSGEMSEVRLPNYQWGVIIQKVFGQHKARWLNALAFASATVFWNFSVYSNKPIDKYNDQRWILTHMWYISFCFLKRPNIGSWSVVNV